MATKKEIPTKHRTKSITEEDERIIRHIQEVRKQEKGGFVSFLEAKHEWFEAKENNTTQLLLSTIGYGAKATAKETKEQEAVGEESGPKKKRRGLSISEAKLGVTMVLSRGDCRKLGLSLALLTSEAIRQVRTKLSLPEKQIKD